MALPLSPSHSLAAKLVPAQAASKRKGEGRGGCQRGLAGGRALRSGGTLERGDSGALDPLAQLGDALGGVGAAAKHAEAAELVIAQAESKGRAEGGCQQGPTRERALRCCGALERGDRAAPEPFTQLGDALGGVGATALVVDAAELAAAQPASKGGAEGGCFLARPDKRAGATVRWRTRASVGAVTNPVEAAEVVAAQAASEGEGAWGCQRGLTRGRALRCGGTLERGDCAAPEPLAQLGDALGGVGAVEIAVEAAEMVEAQAASRGEGGDGCQMGLPICQERAEGALRCGCALERGDGAAREPLAQLGDALAGVGAAATVVEAAELVAPQAASKGCGPFNTPETAHRGRGRQHEAEQPRADDANAGFIEAQGADCIVLSQPLHKNPKHLARRRAGHSCEQQLGRWLTLALDAAAQGRTTEGIFALIPRQIRVPHRLHIHHEAVAVQPCQLRQQLLATCHHHPPQLSGLLQALHVQVGDVSDACGLRLPLDVTVAQMAQPTPQLAPPQSIVQPTPQLAARAGAPRHAQRLEPAQSCGVRLTKRGLEHIVGRHQGYATLHPRRAFRLLL
eukprot:scaffold8619_cov52-Phaeocystis_antarctica.AAC.2